MKYIAPYITQDEYSCHHCKKLPPGLDVHLPAFVFHLLFTRFEEIRKQWGKPLNITSGYRCPDYQRFLWNASKSDSPISVHIFGLALDISVGTKDEVKRLVSIAEGIDSELRLGFQQYLKSGQTFMHMDVGYLISPVFDVKLHEGARW
jgi:uncharacterized protein YcbK (DUF882 family)